MTQDAATTVALYRQPVLVNREQHAGKHVAPVLDWSIARGLNAVPLTAVEFLDAAREFPIAFVPSGNGADGKAQVTPVLLLGLSEGQNLFVDSQGQWSATYLPAFLRRYPFIYAAGGESGQLNLAVDEAWPGFGGSQGELLLTAQGEPTPYLQNVLQFLDNFEREMLRTRVLCDRLVALELLRGGEIQGQLADGAKINAGGFFMIDEERLSRLPDEAVLELHRIGLMGLIHAHRVSMGNVQALAKRAGG